MELQKLPKTHLIEGPITTDLACRLQATEAVGCGASAFFMGTIRSDSIGGKRVSLMDYSSYRPMAERIFSELAERLGKAYSLTDIFIYHSVGAVMSGEVSMLVFVRSAHRAAAFEGLRAAVEAIKAEAPVWKREVFEDGSYRWV